jgi:hypothetical protein
MAKQMVLPMAFPRPGRACTLSTNNRIRSRFLIPPLVRSSPLSQPAHALNTSMWIPKDGFFM